MHLKGKNMATQKYGNTKINQGTVFQITEALFS